MSCKGKDGLNKLNSQEKDDSVGDHQHLSQELFKLDNVCGLKKNGKLGDLGDNQEENSFELWEN